MISLGALYILAEQLLWFWCYTSCNVELGISEPSIYIFRREWVRVCFVHGTSLSWTLLFKPWSPWPVLLYSLQLFAKAVIPSTPSSFTGISPHSCFLPSSPSAYLHPCPSPLLPNTVQEVFPLLQAGLFPQAQAPLAQPPPLHILSLLHTQTFFWLHLHFVPSILKETCLDSGSLFTTTLSGFFLYKAIPPLRLERVIHTPHFLPIKDSIRYDLVSPLITPLLWLVSPDASCSGHAFSSLS